jgi:hypothetical protein
MTFFTLHPKDCFGGRVVLLKNDIKAQTEELDTIENLIQMKKRESKRDQGTLSVVRRWFNWHIQIADCAEVEVLLMDRSQMSFFPEQV